MRNLNAQIIPATDITTNPVSGAIDSNQLFSASFQGVVTGSSPVGTLKIQASNDFDNAGNMAPFTPTNWTDVANASVAISATGSVLIPQTDLCYRWIRAVYVKTSGTGTIAVSINAVGY